MGQTSASKSYSLSQAESGTYTWSRLGDDLMWAGAGVYGQTSVLWAHPSRAGRVNRLRLPRCGRGFPKRICGGFAWGWSGNSVLVWHSGPRPISRLVRMDLRGGRVRTILSVPHACGKGVCVSELGSGGLGIVSLGPHRFVSAYDLKGSHRTAFFDVVTDGRARPVGHIGPKQAESGGWLPNPSGSGLLITWDGYLGKGGRFIYGAALWRPGEKDARELGFYLDVFWLYRR